MTIHGGCRCGAIRYEMSKAPDRISVCHCRDCQKSSGAPLVVWAAFPKEALAVTAGEAKACNTSGETLRYFCGRCGTGLFYVNEAFLPGIVDVQTMTFDDPSAFAPTARVQTAEQPAWQETLHALPAFERFPDVL